MKPFKIITITIVVFTLLSFGFTASAKSDPGSVTKKNIKKTAPCKRLPSVQVVNNAGIPIFKARIGTVEFSRNLSRCFDGCSTGFKLVSTGRHTIAVKVSKKDSWKKIGILGKFDNCRHYAVNIIKQGGAVCAILALRTNTDITFNHDRTKKIIAKTCSRPVLPMKGKATTPAVVKTETIKKQTPVQKKPSPPKPRFQARDKKLFMEFPKTVQKVTVYNQKGTVLQKFGKGRAFDITKSLMQVKAGTIVLGISPTPGTPVPMRWDPRDRIPYELSHHRALARNYIFPEDSTTIESHEPANNNISGAPLLGAGYAEGEVGGDDAMDYIRISSLGDGTGTLVKVEVVSGSVELDLYGPTRTYLDGRDRKVWIALAQGASCYVAIQPTGYTSTDYRISISKRLLNDAYEANDNRTQAKTFGVGKAFLGNVINSGGHHVGFNDFYKVRINDPKSVRVNVSNVGLVSGKRVTVSLYEPGGTHVSTENYAGNTSGCTFNYDLRPDWDDPSYPVPFPAGDWVILVSEYSSNESGIGSPAAYGRGNPPQAYTRADYDMTVTLTP